MGLFDLGVRPRGPSRAGEDRHGLLGSATDGIKVDSRLCGNDGVNVTHDHLPIVADFVDAPPYASRVVIMKAASLNPNNTKG